MQLEGNPLRSFDISDGIADRDEYSSSRPPSKKRGRVAWKELARGAFVVIEGRFASARNGKGRLNVIVLAKSYLRQLGVLCRWGIAESLKTCGGPSGSVARKKRHERC